MDYFILSASEDGDVSMVKLSKSEVEKRINENYYGNDFLTKMPKDRDVHTWQGVMIIKGEIISPKPVKIVQEYTID